MDKRAEQLGQIHHATVPVTLAAAADEAGAIEAIVSAYDVDYSMGWRGKHRIVAGAFDESIAEQAAIPLFWEHDWASMAPGMPIGHGTAEDVDEPKAGLKVAGELYINSDEVKRVHRAALAGAIREWSIGYRILEAEYPEDDETLTIVKKGELLEASLVVRGANPETETLGVASRPGEDGELRQLVATMVAEQLKDAAEGEQGAAGASASEVVIELAEGIDPVEVMSNPALRAEIAARFSA